MDLVLMLSWDSAGFYDFWGFEGVCPEFSVAFIGYRAVPRASGRV